MPRLPMIGFPRKEALCFLYPGMDAVKQFLLDAGGHIHLHLENPPDNYTESEGPCQLSVRFIITLPQDTALLSVNE